MKKFRPPKLPPKKGFLVTHGTSGEELELYNSIKLMVPSVPVYRSDRFILHGRELDIYIPSLKLAFEYDGLYYHNSSKKDDKNYHLYKTQECENQGIRLIHIFSDDWEYRKVLVLDLIAKSLGKFQMIETCYVTEITKAEGRKFLDGTHLKGDDSRADKYVALVYNNTTITVAALRKLKDGSYRITRLSERRGLRVRNQIQQITNFIIKTYNCKVSVSLDRSLYNGSDFKAAGYEFVEDTDPETLYTKDFKSRITEAVDGAVKVYNCGKRILEYKN